jgi:shikimate kinase
VKGLADFRNGFDCHRAGQQSIQSPGESIAVHASLRFEVGHLTDGVYACIGATRTHNRNTGAESRCKGPLNRLLYRGDAGLGLPSVPSGAIVFYGHAVNRHRTHLKLRMQHTRVVLTGFMASGKSTVGPLLAARLGVHFLDLDTLVEKREGRSVADLFRDRGEAFFRRAESDALEEVLRGKSAVVALGGGTFLEEENRARISKAAVSVWLAPDSDEIVRRLERSRNSRPLLRKQDGSMLRGDALTQRVVDLLAARESAYSKADVVIKGKLNKDPQAMVDAICGSLSKRAPENDV